MAGAIAVSATSSRALLMCAVGLAAGWWNFVSSWDMPNAAMIYSSFLIDTDSVDLWALFNGINGCLCLYLWHQNGQKPDWLILLYVLLLSGCYFDVLYWAELLPWRSFKGAIDLIFISEIALLYAVGRDDARNLIFSHVRRWRLFLRDGVLQPAKALMRRGL